MLLVLNIRGQQKDEHDIHHLPLDRIELMGCFNWKDAPLRRAIVTV